MKNRFPFSDFKIVFTFQYGSNQNFLDPRQKKLLNTFTFQYGSNQMNTRIDEDMFF